MNRDNISQIQDAIKDFEDAIRMLATDYISISSVETAMEALKKQIPKKPKDVGTHFRYHGKRVSDGVSIDKCYECPNCLTNIFHVWDSDKYCPKCGQALDWSAEE